jgi:hypothetical protein
MTGGSQTCPVHNPKPDKVTITALKLKEMQEELTRLKAEVIAEFERGVTEGKSAQAILEIQSRQRFMDWLGSILERGKMKAIGLMEVSAGIKQQGKTIELLGEALLDVLRTALMEYDWTQKPPEIQAPDNP